MPNWKDTAISVLIAVFVVFGLVWIPFQIHERRAAEGLAQTGSPAWGEHPSIEAEIEAATRMPAGAVGSPVQDLRAEYASKYHKAHVAKVAEVGHCEGCGITKEELEANGKHLETHHEISVKRIFDEGLDHSLIYDPANFCVFCRPCHHDFGHPHGWSESNPNVRRDAARNLSKTTQAP